MVGFHSWWTVVVLAIFVGIAVWVFTRRKGYYDESARIPFDEDDRKRDKAKKDKDEDRDHG